MPDKDQQTDPLKRNSDGPKLRSHKIRIEVVKGDEAGKVVDLPGLSVRIGSSQDCDFVLTDKTVSRQHLELHIEKEFIRVKDLGSRNGTWIDGTEVRDAYARPDSLIVVGGTTLRLRMLADVVELPISPQERFGGLLGKSVAMRRVFTLLERVSRSDATVLIEGESGTGKELVAQGIYEASPRAGGPFEVFDCSAVAPNLIESALFGHVRGAFTGAAVDRPGIFEEAHGGTLFLDELGELPLELQPKLLRVLEAHEVRRVGDNQVRKVDVRVVAATNRLLSQDVERGRFREDLYYRLSVIKVRIPPLRERAEDIPLLVRYFEKQLAARSQQPSPPLPESLIQAFCTQTWPGNVRELRNAVDRALVLGCPELWGEPEPQASELQVLGVNLKERLLEGRRRVVDSYTREYLTQVLQETGGNISRAAEQAGVTRGWLHKAIKRYGLRESAED